MKKYKISLLAFVLVCTLTPIMLSAQYFGQNKPRYSSFDFEIRQSDNFDVYHYLNNEDVVDDIALKSEQWYSMHKAILQDSFTRRNPIVLYNNHADFQQTNTISGSVGVGTGGVTEAFKNRVVFPLTFTNEQTNHVLGHEMVHAFQYNMILGTDSTGLSSLANLPLWMVEGLAEYLSKGKVDPFTAMWMRSSVLNDDIPTLRDLQNPKYFPYRYGQAFWAFVTSTYGDEVIRPLFLNTALYGFDQAISMTLSTSVRNLETLWAETLENHYRPYITRNSKIPGELISSGSNSGEMNVSPSISPNGKYMTYWSEKDVLGTSMYLAEVTSGDILRKITDVVRDGHLDAINFLEASGAWSRNSKEFAFVGIKKGRNVIIIKDVESGKTIDEISIKSVPSLTHLAWNPDGKSIVFTGLVQGQTDLYEYTFKNKRLRQLTNNPYSEIMAVFNQDGSKLLYSTDYKSMKFGRKYGRYSFDIAIMDMESLDVEVLDIFNGANNLNPNWDDEGNIIFLSNRDGYRNMYKYYPANEYLEQLTQLSTGISGITELAPAVSVSQRRDRIIYSVFDDFKYSIYRVNYSDLITREVDPNEVDFTAGMLPFENLQVTDAVNKNLQNQDKIRASKDNITLINRPYKPKFALDFIGGGAGVGVNNNTFGNNTGLAGGVQLLFSDQLGNNQIFSTLSLNGEIFDVGGQVSYLNRSKRIAYGFGISHVPLVTGFSEAPFLTQLPINNGQSTIEVVQQNLNLIRVFSDNVNAFLHLPFSRTLRLEGGISGGYQSFRWDEYRNYYQINAFGQYQQVARDRERIPTGDMIQFDQFYTLERGFQASANIALVGDNSIFGMTSPLRGHRFRLSVEQHVGINRYTAFLADARKYFWLKPLSFAIRGTTFNRIDLADDNNVYPFFIGQQGFVRGYGSAFSNFQQVAIRLEDKGISFGQVIGANMAMASGEIRLPLTGPRRLALIPTSLLMSDLVLFYDVGVAYNSFSDFEATIAPYLTMSTGIGARINAFGALIVEPYYAYLPRESQWVWGFNLIPGW